MKNLFCTRNIFSAISVLAVASQAYGKPDGNEFIKFFNEKVGSKVYSPKSLPQNFGGEKEKLNLNQSSQIKEISLKIAISDEAIFDKAQRQTIAALEDLILKKEIRGASNLFKDKAVVNFGNFTLSKRAGLPPIEEFDWKNIKSTSKAIPDQLNDYLVAFKTIEHIDINAISAATSLNERHPETYQPKSFKTKINFDIRGTNLKGFRRQDRFAAYAEIEKNNDQWKFSSLEVQEGETLLAKNVEFQKESEFSQINPTIHLRREAIRRGGYALSICDYNNDGYQDIIVGQLGSIEIFQGQSKGFQNVKPASLGLSEETLVKSISCNDFDNDGKKDLLLVRFAPNEEKGKDIVLYHNRGTSFEKRTTIRNRMPAFYAMPSAVADFNQDGLLDFYVGFPGAKDFTVLNKTANGFAGEVDAHPQGLFYNSGSFEFTEVSRQKIPYSKTKNPYTDGYPESSVVFPHTSAGVDYNLDGKVDIVVVDDKANLSPLYQNTGKGNFKQVAEKIGVTNFDFGMGFAAGDLNNDGTLEFVYTNVNFEAAERLKNSLIENFSIYDRFPGIDGVRIFQSKDHKNYSDVTALSGIKNTGYGVGGVEMLDYNNDGYLDFYIPAGLWSGNFKNNDISSLFVRAFATLDLDYQETVGSAVGVENANTSFMKILTDFQGDIDTLNKKSNMFASMEGFQRNRLFRNNRNGTFTEVGFLAGVDSVSDGYVVGTADLNKDGKMDIVLRNADPGTENNKFPAVEIYLNKSQTESKSVILTLQGTSSNFDAIGAIVKAQIGKQTITRFLMANNGAVQSESALHFGLGKANKIDQIDIFWPSGEQEVLKSILPGRYHVVEKKKIISKF